MSGSTTQFDRKKSLLLLPFIDLHELPSVFYFRLLYPSNGSTCPAIRATNITAKVLCKVTFELSRRSRTDPPATRSAEYLLEQSAGWAAFVIADVNDKQNSSLSFRVN
jgi:hypothetical protein